MTITAKCSDLCTVTIEGKSRSGYVPSGFNIGGGDYIDIKICAHCGTAIGKWPLPAHIIDQYDDDEDEYDSENTSDEDDSSTEDFDIPHVNAKLLAGAPFPTGKKSPVAQLPKVLLPNNRPTTPGPKTLSLVVNHPIPAITQTLPKVNPIPNIPVISGLSTNKPVTPTIPRTVIPTVSTIPSGGALAGTPPVISNVRPTMPMVGALLNPGDCIIGKIQVTPSTIQSPNVPVANVRTPTIPIIPKVNSATSTPSIPNIGKTVSVVPTVPKLNNSILTPPIPKVNSATSTPPIPKVNGTTSTPPIPKVNGTTSTPLVVNVPKLNNATPILNLPKLNGVTASQIPYIPAVDVSNLPTTNQVKSPNIPKLNSSTPITQISHILPIDQAKLNQAKSPNIPKLNNATQIPPILPINQTKSPNLQTYEIPRSPQMSITAALLNHTDAIVPRSGQMATIGAILNHTDLPHDGISPELIVNPNVIGNTPKVPDLLIVNVTPIDETETTIISPEN
jgi:hypothetical protein